MSASPPKVAQTCGNMVASSEKCTHNGQLAITSQQLQPTDPSLLEDSALDLDSEGAERQLTR